MGCSYPGNRSVGLIIPRYLSAWKLAVQKQGQHFVTGLPGERGYCTKRITVQDCKVQQITCTTRIRKAFCSLGAIILLPTTTVGRGLCTESNFLFPPDLLFFTRAPASRAQPPAASINTDLLKNTKITSTSTSYRNFYTPFIDLTFITLSQCNDVTSIIQRIYFDAVARRLLCSLLATLRNLRILPVIFISGTASHMPSPILNTYNLPYTVVLRLGTQEN